MKLIIQNNRVAATATDEYSGPEQFIAAPVDFDISRLSDYTYSGGVLSLTAGTRITKLAFRNRFTTAEKVALEIASLDDPAAAMSVRQQAATLRANLADVAAATFIDLSRSDTRAGVQMLETATLIAAGRAAVILDTAPADVEIYRP